MTYEQQRAIQNALIDEINSQYDVLDEHLLGHSLAFTEAIETHKRIKSLQGLLEYVQDEVPLEGEPEPENPDALTIGKVFGTPETTPLLPDPPTDPQISERLVYDGTNASAFVRMLLGI